MKKFLFVLLLALGPVFQPIAMAATTTVAKIYSVTSDQQDFVGKIIFYLVWNDENGKFVGSATIFGKCYIHYIGDNVRVVIDINGSPYSGHYDVMLPANNWYNMLVEYAKGRTGASNVNIGLGKNELLEE